MDEDRRRFLLDVSMFLLCKDFLRLFLLFYCFCIRLKNRWYEIIEIWIETYEKLTMDDPGRDGFAILRWFNEKFDGRKKCGHCSFCQSSRDFEHLYSSFFIRDFSSTLTIFDGEIHTIHSEILIIFVVSPHSLSQFVVNLFIIFHSLFHLSTLHKSLDSTTDICII